jgi:hypothetical protein
VLRSQEGDPVSLKFFSLPAFMFSLIANLLARAPLSPALRSALYQVAARLPGLGVVLHARDLIGRSAAEVYVAQPQVTVPTGEALYFNPSTGAAFDVAGDLDGISPFPRCPGIWQDAVLASGYVGSKYQLPAGAVRTPRRVTQPRPFSGCSAQATPQPAPGATFTPLATPVTSGPVATPTPSATPGSPAAPTPTPLPMATA